MASRTAATVTVTTAAGAGTMLLLGLLPAVRVAAACTTTLDRCRPQR